MNLSESWKKRRHECKASIDSKINGDARRFFFEARKQGDRLRQIAHPGNVDDENLLHHRLSNHIDLRFWFGLPRIPQAN